MDEETRPFEWSLYQRAGLGWSWTLLGVIGGFGPAVVYLVQRGGTCYSSAQRTSCSVSTASQLP